MSDHLEGQLKTQGINKNEPLYKELGKPNVTLFFIEKLGFLFILISGVMPFVHAFVKHKVLEEKIFGFDSYHILLYSLGVHLCVFLLVIGVLLTISIVDTPYRYKIIQRYLRYTMISPFVSGVFYLSWVFIPDVNYNYLAYVFLAMLVCVLSILIFFQVLRYIHTLKLANRHRETVVKDGLSYLESKLKKE